MSRSATTTELNELLGDYKIHLTGYDPLAHEQEQPPHWPRDRHRVPAYRPINKNLDPRERPNGSNAKESAFLAVMFLGVFTNATLAKTWGVTGGRVFPGVLSYAIGGEW